MTKPRRILITGARAPVALHLCRLLSGPDCTVFLADTYRSPLGAASAKHSGYTQLPPPRYDLDGYRDGLAKAVETHQIDLIIPTCEEVFFLAILAERGALAAPLFAPDLALLQRVHNKFEFMELARGYGLDVPDTALVTSVDEVRATNPRESVYKPVWSRFASEVLIRPSVAQLRSIRPSMAAPWVVQACVEGEEVSVYAVARSGILVACSAYRSVFRAGKGAGVCFAPVQDNAVTEWVRRFVEACAWDGQISFDMIRQADGSVLPLECNPRATSGLHFFGKPEVFARAVWDGEPVAPDVTGLLASRLALWLYGAPQAIRTGRLKEFREALRDAIEILDWPEDHAPIKAQLRALREIAGIALRERISLQQASTRDIEWNGPDQD